MDEVERKGEHEMQMLRNLITRATRASGNRFDRYYAGVAHSGPGYPTADEARRDIRNAAGHPMDWTR